MMYSSGSGYNNNILVVVIYPLLLMFVTGRGEGLRRQRYAKQHNTLGGGWVKAATVTVTRASCVIPSLA